MDLRFVGVVLLFSILGCAEEREVVGVWDGTALVDGEGWRRLPEVENDYPEVRRGLHLWARPDGGADLLFRSQTGDRIAYDLLLDGWWTHDEGVFSFQFEEQDRNLWCDPSETFLSCRFEWASERWVPPDEWGEEEDLKRGTVSFARGVPEDESPL